MSQVNASRAVDHNVRDELGARQYELEQQLVSCQKTLQSTQEGFFQLARLFVSSVRLTDSHSDLVNSLGQGRVLRKGAV